MNKEIKEQFPAANKYTYLNSAAVSPIPTKSAAAVMSQLEDVSKNGALNYLDWLATKNRARKLIADMLGVDPYQIAFMRNTSDGFSAVANSLKWKSGDNIVSFEREFPANFYAWRMVRDRYDVQLRMCPEEEGRVDIEKLISLIDNRTRIVSISSVQFASGFKADIERIGRVAKSAGALFAVDVIQGLGAFGYDLTAQNVDIAAGASHKWLCAPEGCGILYLSDRAREMMDPAFVGWISVEKPWDFDDREQPFKDNALALESGTGTSSLFYGLEESLKLLSDTGLRNIENYLEELTNELCQQLVLKNYEIVSSRKNGERSAIICIKHRGGLDCESIAEHLLERDIIVSARNGRVRIAPHFYNDADDIYRLVRELPD